MTDRPIPARFLAQRRARHAWQAVAACKKLESATEKTKYAREAKRLPVRIMTSGLGMALAFMLAKAGAAGEMLAGDLAGWLLRERGLAKTQTVTDGTALCKAIIEQDADFLRRASEEALLYLQWLTRFAEAEIDTDDRSTGP